MEKNRVLRISEAARSVFYLPLLATVVAGFLEKEGYQGILGTEPGKGAERLKQLEQGVVDILGNTPTLSFSWLEQQIKGDLPPQVAALTHCDGFFIVGREPAPQFQWNDLQDAELITSNFSLQPLASLRMCLSLNNIVKTDKIKILSDFTTMNSAAQAFKEGRGDFVHLQEPLASILVEENKGYIVASVGESLGPLAFSTIAMSRRFIENRLEAAEAFMRAYQATLRWIETSDPENIAETTGPLFAGTSKKVLAASIKNYKSIGAWRPDLVISKATYERMVDMWIEAGHMKNRYPYERIVSNELVQRV
jgi:NitT/TauT family transport system substrate-binding protein